MNHRFAALFLSAVALCAVGCGLIESSEQPADEIDLTVPPFQGGRGQAAEPPDHAYAPGPYGVGVGLVISDLHFFGFAGHADTDGDCTELALDDFYNPTGDEKGPDDAAYKGARPHTLVVSLANTWCPSSWDDKASMSATHAAARKNGVEYLEVLLDAFPDHMATSEDLRAWLSRPSPNGGVSFPVVIDPEGTTAAIAGDYLPAEIVIDTRTMRITAIELGPDASFWQEMANGSTD